MSHDTYPNSISSPRPPQAVSAAETFVLPLEIETGHWPFVFRSIITVTALLFCGLLALAAVAPLRELAISEGQIVTERAVMQLQHLEGGIVGTIKVKAGQAVDQGELLLAMDGTAAQSELEQVEARRLNLLGARIRLEALLSGVPPDFAAVARRNPTVAREQSAQFASDYDSLEKARLLHASRIAQRRAEIEASEDDLISVEAQIASHRERVQMRQKLLLDGLATRSSLLDAKVALDQALSRRAQVRGQVDSGRSAFKEAADALADLEATRRAAWSADLTRVASDFAETDQILPKLLDRIGRLAVRSPTRGLVQSVVPRVAGDVVRPGDVVLEIVPFGDALLAEVRLKPEDVGYVKEGRPARVKLTAFDPEAFGAIDAVVASVSPTTFQSDKGEPFYKARLAIAKTRLVRGTEFHDLLPGMVVRAEIKTGEKSVLRYLLKPIYRSIDTTFSER